MAWLAAFCGSILVGLDLPLPVRITACLCTATASAASIQSLFTLRGPRAIRGLRWTEAGQWYAFVGQPGRELSAVLAPGSCRLGRRWLLLWVETCDGTFSICIDGTGQDPRAFRRLCRRLEAINSRSRTSPEA